MAFRSRKLLRHVKLTPEGWVFLVVLAFVSVGAILRNVNLLVVMAGMMCVSLFINWRLSVHHLKTLAAKRRVPGKLHANRLANFQWTCTNRSNRVPAWNLVVHDQIRKVADEDLDSEDLTPVPKKRFWSNSILVYWFSEVFERVKRRKVQSVSEVEICFPAVETGQSELQSYRTYFGQRGKYMIGPATLSTTFPFGLIICKVTYPEVESFYVGPRLGQLDPTWEQRVQASAVGSEALKRRRSVEEDEFYALRPWRSGDTKKNIHWRSTAKMGVPIIKQYDQQTNRDFGLLIDLYANSEQDRQLCELAISFAATTLFDIKHDVHGQVALGICGEETRICSSRSQHGVLLDSLRYLSTAKPTGVSELESTIALVANLVSKGTPIYVVSSREKPEHFDLDVLTARINAVAGLVTATELRELRVLKQYLPMIRWIHVESSEFEQMFEMNTEADDQELRRFNQTLAEGLPK